MLHIRMFHLKLVFTLMIEIAQHSKSALHPNPGNPNQETPCEIPTIPDSAKPRRQILLFPPGFDSHSLKHFKQSHSIRKVAHTCDFQDSSWSAPKTDDAQLIIFDRIGVGLITLDDPNKLSVLIAKTRQNRSIKFIRSESELQLSILPDSHSELLDEWDPDQDLNAPTLNPMPRIQRVSNHSQILKGFEDDLKQTWAMQACGVNQLRWSGKGVKIAILDTGIDLNHPDWSGRQFNHRNFIDQSILDLHGHGTQCAGLAAGFSTDKHLPRFSAAPMADLHIAKVLNPDGSGPDSAILAGIDWALSQGCQILSLSVGTQMADSKPDPVYEHVARQCLKSGLLFMAAAGNDSFRPGLIRPVCRPANSPSVFAVGAIDRYLRLANFTNGSFLKTRAQIDAVAPGVDVFTTSIGPKPYGRFSGTSMAAPLCAGLAALIVQDDPDCLGGLLWQRLASLAKRLPLLSTDVGMGLVSLPSSRSNA